MRHVLTSCGFMFGGVSRMATRSPQRSQWAIIWVWTALTISRLSFSPGMVVIRSGTTTMVTSSRTSRPSTPVRAATSPLNSAAFGASSRFLSITSICSCSRGAAAVMEVSRASTVTNFGALLFGQATATFEPTFSSLAPSKDSRTVQPPLGAFFSTKKLKVTSPEAAGASGAFVSPPLSSFFASALTGVDAAAGAASPLTPATRRRSCMASKPACIASARSAGFP